MIEENNQLFANTARSDWLRLRTMVMLRWLAIAGQGGAILVTTVLLHIDLQLDVCLTIIGASVTYNIVATVTIPQNNRLSERAAMLTLMFDLGQLALLLMFTGGLANPFSILLLAPVIISATTLKLPSTIILGVAFVLADTLLLLFAGALHTTAGVAIEPPRLLLDGTWAALITAMAFVGIYARRVTLDAYSMSDALMATQLALDREQQLTALGGVVAAAAHELGTPLTTIKLVAAEMLDELDPDSELAEDAGLIGQQADRCRDILRDMGRTGKDDMLVRNAPVSAVVDEAAAPHLHRGKNVVIRVLGEMHGIGPSDQPEIPRQAEIVHGLRNLVQNAVDFSAENVWIDVDWDDRFLRIRVGDDGVGYPADLIGRIGDPFVRKRDGAHRQNQDRKGYEGMGLGLFIAKTLLERSGAQLTFANGTEAPRRAMRKPDVRSQSARPTGAIVEVVWKRVDIETKRSQIRGPLGLNKPLVWPG